MSGKSVVDTTQLLRDSSWVPYYDKIYVDEVQDYTQAEIAVFLLAVGFKTDALFLAGDPAQSVVEGVDFRFEEVRSLVYNLTAGRESIQRPIKLITNYRSHNGVLACAAAIIEKLLLMFPGSANVLSKDEGLFTGPRPNYCTVKDPVEILRVLGKGVAVLAPDSSPWLKCPTSSSTAEDVAREDTAELEGEIEEGAGTTFTPALPKLADLVVVAPVLEIDGIVVPNLAAASAGVTADAEDSGILHLGNTVMGIRAAKGLEFSDVMILDFFRHIPEHDHKAWKVLFADNNQADVQVRDKQFEYPQLEPQLKMLYTAITRSMNRLLFVETASTAAGEAFFRWLERHQLAEKYDLATARKHGEERFITADEWKVRGIQFAGQVDSATVGGAEAAVGLLDNAIQCFTNAGDVALKSAAALQKRLVQCKLKLLSASATGATATGADATAAANSNNSTSAATVSTINLNGSNVNSNTNGSGDGNSGAPQNSLEAEVSKAILAGLEGGLFEDTRDLCQLWAEQLKPEYLKPLFRAKVHDELSHQCDF